MRWLMVAVVAAGLGAGCERRASPHASGSGYGVGIPRTHFMVGQSPERRWTRGLRERDHEYAGTVRAQRTPGDVSADGQQQHAD